MDVPLSVTLSILRHMFKTMVLRTQVPSSLPQQTTGKVTTLLAAAALL